MRCLEDVGADIGDDALAEPVHAIEAGGACQGEDEADAEQGCEIFVDEARLHPAEADIDHAPHGKRQASVAAAETMSAASAAAIMPR